METPGTAMESSGCPRGRGKRPALPLHTHILHAGLKSPGGGGTRDGSRVLRTAGERLLLLLPGLPRVTRPGAPCVLHV